MGQFLKEKFPTVAAAEEAYGICYFGEKESRCVGQTVPSTPVMSGAATSSRSPLLGFSPLRHADVTKLPGCILDVISSGFTKLTPRQREQLLQHLFRQWMVNDINQGINLDSDFLPFNFLVLAAKAMAVLHANGKDNLIYHAARCFGEQRQGSTGPRMPLDRMPFGLVAHNLKFFASDNVSNLQAPDDYKSWCQSMYTLFGNKWASMHLGPMWSYEVSENISATANANESCFSLDIISQALHETLGDDIPLVSAENSLPVLENVKDTSAASDVVQSGRTIKGDPLKVQYTMSYVTYINEMCFNTKLLVDYYYVLTKNDLYIIIWN